jgi:hypothetical protein
MNWESAFEKPWNVVLYIIAAMCLYADFIQNTHLTIYLCLPAFFAWDLAFILHPGAWRWSEPKFMLERTMMTMSQVAWFIPIYAAVVGALVTLLPGSGGMTFKSVLKAADLSYTMVALPLIIASVSLLMVPIHSARFSEKKSESDTPVGTCSAALRAMLFFVMFGQKATVVLFVHGALALISQLP